MPRGMPMGVSRETAAQYSFGLPGPIVAVAATFDREVRPTWQAGDFPLPN